METAQANGETLEAFRARRLLAIEKETIFWAKVDSLKDMEMKKEDGLDKKVADICRLFGKKRKRSDEAEADMGEAGGNLSKKARCDLEVTESRILAPLFPLPSGITIISHLKSTILLYQEVWFGIPLSARKKFPINQFWEGSSKLQDVLWRIKTPNDPSDKTSTYLGACVWRARNSLENHISETADQGCTFFGTHTPETFYDGDAIEAGTDATDEEDEADGDDEDNEDGEDDEDGEHDEEDMAARQNLSRRAITEEERAGHARKLYLVTHRVIAVMSHPLLESTLPIKSGVPFGRVVQRRTPIKYY